jgi:polar amino acid transport system substrate-binding protein
MDFRLQKLSIFTRNFLPSILLGAVLAHSSTPGFGQPEQRDGKLPRTIDATDRLQRGDLSGFTRLRFLTTLDFPPYNYLSADGRLTGFNIDLTRAICRELAVENLCQIQALPWEDLDKSLATGNGEAVIAGRVADAKARAEFAFSRPYLRMAARFIGKKTETRGLSSGLQKTVIGVAGGTAHEQMLRSYFPKAQIIAVAGDEAAAQLLLSGKAGAVFGDASAPSGWPARVRRIAAPLPAGRFFPMSFSEPECGLRLRRKIPRLRTALTLRSRTCKTTACWTNST